MPAVYPSSVPDAVQSIDESNRQIRVRASSNFTMITSPQNSNSTTTNLHRTLADVTTTAPKRLSPVAIVFIVLGVLAAFSVLCYIIYYFYRRHKQHKPSSSSSSSSRPSSTPVVRTVINPVEPPKRPPLKPHRVVPPSPVIDAPQLICRQPLCKDYLDKLNIAKAYFAPEHDKCYCKKCHDRTDTDPRCSDWCREYHGWTIFGLQVHRGHLVEHKIMKTWKTSYYGTTPDRVSAILKARFVPLDGDALANGILFDSGHPDTKNCTTCPTLVGASQRKFSPRVNFRAKDGNNYNVQVILRCKQKPGEFTVKENPKSPKNVEWTTVARSVTVPYALLMRLYKT